MHDAKNLDRRLFDAIDQEIRRAGDNELTRAGNPAMMPDSREASETRRCLEDPRENARRRDRIARGDEVAQRVEIV
jgi:hypothetical protein